MNERHLRNDGHEESELEAALRVLSRLAGSPDTAIRIETDDLRQVLANECFRDYSVAIPNRTTDCSTRKRFIRASRRSDDSATSSAAIQSRSPTAGCSSGTTFRSTSMGFPVGLRGSTAISRTERTATTNGIPRATADRTLDQVFNALPYACTIVGIADGRFLNVNEAFCQGFGFERSEVIGRTSVELGLWVNVEDRERLIRRALAAGYLHEAQIDALTKSGDLKTVLLSVERIERPEGVCLLAIWNDVTERVAAQSALLRRDAQLRRLVDANPLGVFFSDFSGRSRKRTRRSSRCRLRA